MKVLSLLHRACFWSGEGVYLHRNPVVFSAEREESDTFRPTDFTAREDSGACISARARMVKDWDLMNVLKSQELKGTLHASTCGSKRRKVSQPF